MKIFKNLDWTTTNTDQLNFLENVIIKLCSQNDIQEITNMFSVLLKKKEN